MKLHLRAPLNYSKIPLEEKAAAPESPKDELLFCYKLNLRQSKSIEPDKELLLDSLEFAGRPAENTAAPPQPQETAPPQMVSLPQGVYLFTQQRSEKPLNQSEWLDLAIEQQKDGLWERDNPKAVLYVRFLYEDKAFVTQVFRQIECDNADGVIHR